MHYLKCEHCGFLNTVKTEFLTLCTSCGKKIANNYQDIHKKNPTLSFDDYKEKFCTNDNGPHKIEYKAPVNRLAIVIGVLVGVVMMSLLIVKLYFFTGGKLDELITANKPAKEILDKQWSRYVYGNYGLSLETPVEFESVELPNSEQLISVVENYQAFYYRPNKSIQVLCSSILYKEGIMANLEGAANGTMNGIAKSPGISGFSNTFKPVLHNDLEGLMAEATCIENGEQKTITCFFYTKGRVLYQVVTSGNSNDNEAIEICKRIIDSIQITSYS